jgi:tripartite ATP-independent transporter DctM subunit
VGDSIGKLFLAGVIPGILLSSLFILYIFIRAILQPEISPKLEKPSFKKIVLSIQDIFPVTIVIFAVLGTIYLGIATPTEAAALGASLALVLTILYKKMKWKVLKLSLISSMEITLYLMVIVIGAYILSMAFSMERIPAVIAGTISDLNVNRYVIWGILVVMYMAIGMFIDGISIVLLTVPVVHPIMMALGFDSIWLGVVLTICIEMGQITPPVGVNLFVIYGLVGRDFKDIVYGSLPFMLIQIIAVIILTLFPFLVTWLPDQILTQF